MSNVHIKVLFRLVQDSDGYPPVAVESVWATRATPKGYMIDNIPFFARDATLGDTVETIEDDEGTWFSKLIIPSANSLLRIALFDTSRVSELLGDMAKLGCDAEWNEAHSLVAVNVPESGLLGTVQAYLRQASQQGWLDYEEPILR